MRRLDEEVRKRAKEIIERNKLSTRNMFQNEEEKWYRLCRGLAEK